MARQNRVTPFGELVATEARGTLMGNRGCLHDEQQRIRRAFAGRRWIACVLEFRGRRRAVMTPGRYTELFFLDEATALAAGHRPCSECRHEGYRLFRAIWAEANPDLPAGSADEIDAALHTERLDGQRGKRVYPAPASELPVGVMVADGEGQAYLVLPGELRPWQPGGYGPGIPIPNGRIFQVLTPASIVRAIARGYPVGLHPSAGERAPGQRAPR